MLTLGSNIKKARLKLGLTQEELSFQLGVTSQAVSRWESGAGMPDISMIVPLAQTLSVSTDALFGLEQSGTAEVQYMDIKTQLEEIAGSAASRTESALQQCQYLMDLLQKNPSNYVIACCYVESAGNVTRIENFTTNHKKDWQAIREAAIRYGTQVIRFCDDSEWVERTHFALSWIYIHEGNYESAREHINTLPSIASNRLRESLLAQLTLFEHGINEMKNVLRLNLQHFTRALNKEILYAVEDMSFNDEPQTAIDFGLWGIEVMHTLSQNPDMLSYCRGFTRDIYKYIMHADLRAEKYSDAARHFHELQQEMQHHFDCYQVILNSETESARYDARALRNMRAYTQEFISDRQKEILSLLKQWHGKENYKKFQTELE